MSLVVQSQISTSNPRSAMRRTRSWTGRSRNTISARHRERNSRRRSPRSAPGRPSRTECRCRQRDLRARRGHPRRRPRPAYRRGRHRRTRPARRCRHRTAVPGRCARCRPAHRRLRRTPCRFGDRRPWWPCHRSRTPRRGRRIRRRPRNRPRRRPDGAVVEPHHHNGGVQQPAVLPVRPVPPARPPWRTPRPPRRPDSGTAERRNRGSGSPGRSCRRARRAGSKPPGSRVTDRNKPGVPERAVVEQRRGRPPSPGRSDG